MASRNFWAPGSLSRTLNHHRQLCPTAGARVSPIVLCPTTAQDQWQPFGFSSADKEGYLQLLDAYYRAGGNFVDTATQGQDGSLEVLVGEWLQSRDARDNVVVATKYMAAQRAPQHTHHTGNNVNSIRASVEASLERLRVSYIDILYVRLQDFAASIEDVVNGLHNLVTQGRVLHLGIADTPAWAVSRANSFARLTGKTPFVVYRGSWSILQRDVERDILPMVRAEGMALVVRGVLAGGRICENPQEPSGGRLSEQEHMIAEREESDRVVHQGLGKVALQVGAKSTAAVAIAWAMQKAPCIFPVIAGRNMEDLAANIEALGISLHPDHVKYLDDIIPFDKGYPYTEYVEGGL